MIKDIYKKLEDSVNEIDDIVAQKYGDRMKAHNAKQFSNLSICLNKIPRQNDEAIQQCNEAFPHLTTSDLHTQISSHKNRVYECLNTCYMNSQQVKDDGNRNSKKTNLKTPTIDSCLSSFKDDVLKSFSQFEKKHSI